MTDWISWGFKVVNWLQGKRQLIVDVSGSPNTGDEIVRELKRNGINVGQGRYIIGWDLFLMVDQKKRAKRLLEKAGFPCL